MLRLSRISRVAAVAAAFLISTSALAQGGGLGGRITEAGTKLDQDVQACKPINIGEYVELLREAAQNRQRAEKAAKAGVPINQAQVDADLANASALFNRAQAALIQRCMRAAQQGQAPGQTASQGHAQATPSHAGQTGDVATSVVQPTLPAGQALTRPSNETYEGSQTSWDTFHLPGEEWIKQELDRAQYGMMRDPTYRNYESFQSLDYFRDGLRKYIEDAKEVGEYGADVDKAKRMLKEIDDAYNDKTVKLWRRILDAQYAPPPPETPVQPTGQSLNSFERTILNEHNEQRVAVGSPPLIWDPVLAEHARIRATELAGLGELVHAPRAGRGTERENIAQAPLSYTAAQIVDRWVAERIHYVPGIFPNVCDTGGDCSGVWHWTQMIWEQTTNLGCGAAIGGGSNWLVCRYNPGGNKDGKPVVAQTPGFQAGGGMEGRVTEAGQRQTPSASKLDPDLRVRQDWGAQQISEWAKADHAASAGGAWTAGLFNDPIALNHDYGYDAGLFVGYDLGAFRIEAETAYKGVYQGEARDMSWMRDILFSPPAPYVDTNVEQPQLPDDTFKTKPPEKLPDPL